MQSHWFSVGPIVPWARTGVGAIATQASAEVSYGPRGLELLARGAGAEEALRELAAADEFAHTRQVAIVDSHGGVAAHTGTSCIPFAGHVIGEGVSCQANIMASETVWPAMLETFQSTGGPLTGRLLAALEAAEREGGDLRGRQSAAILVVPAQGHEWDTVTALRVEDHPDPLPELRRLLRVHDAYTIAERGDDAAAAGRHDEAAALYEEAVELAPENLELRFWAGLGAAQRGDEEAGLRHVRDVISVNPAWGELLRRLPPDLAPAARSLGARLEDGV